MTEILTTDLFRILTMLIVLLYASYTDIISRKVQDNVWAIPTLIALVILGYEIYYSSEPVNLILMTLFSVLTITGGAYVIYKYRIFYGADYKAFFVISLLFPWYPVINGYIPIYEFQVFYDLTDIPLDSPIMTIKMLISYLSLNVFGFAVFVNATLFSITYFVRNILHNIKSNSFTWNKPLRSSCAKQENVSNLKNIYAQVVIPSKSENFFKRGIEFLVNGLNGLSMDFFRDYEEWHRENKTVSNDVDINELDKLYIEEFVENNDNWMVDNIEEDKKLIEDILDKEVVWVTPGVPFIVPITLGFITATIFGNLIFVVLNLI